MFECVGVGVCLCMGVLCSLFPALFWKCTYTLLTPSCSPLRHSSSRGRGSIAHMLQQYALGHTRTRTHTYTATRTAQSHLGMVTVYLNGSPPPPQSVVHVRAHAHTANRGSITDRPHHPARKYLQQQQQQQQYYTVGCYYAGWLPIDKRNPPPPNTRLTYQRGSPSS